jgi:hypothetical protein
LECLVMLMEWPDEGGVRRLVGMVLPFDAMVKKHVTICCEQADRCRRWMAR